MTKEELLDEVMEEIRAAKPFTTVALPEGVTLDDLLDRLRQQYSDIVGAAVPAAVYGGDDAPHP